MPCSRSMRNLRRGIIKSTPSSPPHKASRVICSSEGGMPQRNRAGRVKMMPLATELEAEPTVWERLASRMVPPMPRAPKARKAATVMTATGIEVEIVRPAWSPR